MENLKLSRPLVVFDLETTGTDPASDRIVEISILRLEPSGEAVHRTRRLNPGRPIPPGATAVHGIRDEDVRDEPQFRQVARSLQELLADADLAGFNVARFDIPLLEREFRDADLDLDLGSRRIVDAMTIFHRKEPRDLSAAVRFYLGREPEGAHSAEADVRMTADIIDAQLARYEDLPRDVEALSEWVSPRHPDAVDREGKLLWKDDLVVLAFGKHQGQPLSLLVERERGYLEWVLQSDFPTDVKEIVRGAIGGAYPRRSGS